MGKSMVTISRTMARHSVRLLDMEYKPSELAQELNCKQDWIMRAIRNHAPHRKDEHGRYWIHGEKFAAWLHETKQKEKKRLKPNECYCLGCKKYTTFLVVEKVGNHVTGKCVKGHRVSMFTKGKRQKVEK
jgi:hypothetical protein